MLQRGNGFVDAVSQCARFVLAQCIDQLVQDGCDMLMLGEISRFARLGQMDENHAFEMCIRDRGMSQRGAQQMANEGFAYDQILEFYYPGLTRTRYTMTRTLLSSCLLYTSRCV